MAYLSLLALFFLMPVLVFPKTNNKFCFGRDLALSLRAFAEHMVELVA
jgi:hypothetical protein